MPGISRQLFTFIPAKLAPLAAVGFVVLVAGCATEPEKQGPIMQSELVVNVDREAPPPPRDGLGVNGAEAQASAVLYSETHSEYASELSSPTEQDGEPDVRLGGLESTVGKTGESALGMDRVLQEVWLSHPNVQRAEAEIEASGYDLQGAKTGFYPYLSLTAVEASNQASQTTLNIIQPIWSGGRVSAEVRQAEAEQNRALAELNQTRLDLAQQAMESYLSVVLAEEQGVLWRRYISSLEDLLRVIKNRAENGVSPPVDIQTAQTRLSQAKAGLAASNAQLVSSRNNLEALVNHPVPPLTWPSARYHLSDSEVGRILEEQSIESHPAGQIAIAGIATQKAAVDQAKASVFPTVSLQYSKALQQSEGDFTPDSSTRLVLQYNSDEGLRGFSNFKAVNQRLNAARQELQFARRDVRDTILSAKASRDIALMQFDAQTEAAQAAVKLVGSFLRQFKVGRKAWLEVLNAHREANDALLQISSIKRSYWSANFQLALQGMLWIRVNENAPSTYIEIENE